MVRVDWEDIVDIMGGGLSGSALYRGDGYEIFNKRERRYWDAVGTYRLELPAWTTGFVAILFSGGGGGQHGDGGNRTSGRGGTSGEGRYSSYTLGTGSARTTRVDITIGSGGIGGRGNSNPAVDGSPSTLYFSSFSMEPSVGRAAASSGQNGTTQGWGSLSDLMSKRFMKPAGSTYSSGPAGSGNGGSAKLGAGGAGGNGGILGQYSNGGRGGDGFCEMYIWGRVPGS